ncbi:MAG: glycosyl transferase [Thermodesulfobacteriota bacterium]|nr:glycosyl transferase [Thermodesulfobacteriota bacterium]
MSDFFQNGVITTLHRLNRENKAALERELMRYTKARPIALVLPALFSELEGAALPKIVEALKAVPYLSQIVITMGQTDAKQFEYARDFFSQLPQEKVIIWNDGPRLTSLYKAIKEEFGHFDKGKGLSAWMAYGYVLASRKSQVIALHDCDILTYDTEVLARLCFPIASTRLNYEFCKGYYSRVTDRLHGRVTRLFVTPLIRALIQMLGSTPFLVYLDSFRYPLAGEFAMVADLAWRNRIPSDWGLEVGVLAEVYRNCTLNGICQADLADNYEHKHQELSAEDVSKGLMKMTTDIAKSLFRTLAGEGVVFSEGFFKSLRTVYVRQAQDAIKRYHDDATINSLFFDRHEEAVAVEAFADSIKIAGEQTLEDPLGIPLIPNWSRVVSALPDFFDLLLEAVDKDNT